MTKKLRQEQDFVAIPHEREMKNLQIFLTAKFEIFFDKNIDT